MKQRLKDQFLQNWKGTINESSKCLIYRVYKKDFCFEKYLDILPFNLCRILCKFRTMNHLLPIEKGRHLHIERNQRICHLCPKQSLGDEFHYLFECHFFNSLRKKFIDSKFSNHPNIYKLESLMNSFDHSILLKLALFCKIIISKFK